MAFYSDDIINEVFGENDIIDYVSQYVRLKKSGKDYSGLCPFHKEKTPSFHVSREKQLFHCFGCGASGNIVQFVMRTEGLDFVEAVKLLAERVGIELPEDSGENYENSHEIKKKIYEMNSKSARFFYDMLTKNPQGKAALSYFQERKILKKTIITYGLGFAPDSFNALHDHLRKLGYTDEDMLTAGLCIERDGKIYDKFRNRVMFPIIDLRGNIIGFGGRIMSQIENSEYKIPKYLNSSETPVFNKGRNLFSLNLAKKLSPYYIILVEGYMDVITVYQAGIENVVATLGTAFGENQAKLLMKYCNEILICYDSDEAGQKATERAIEIMNSVGARSKVITLKGAKDPDEYIKTNGTAMFLKAVNEAVPSTEFRLGLLRKKYQLDSPEGKAMFVSNAAEILKSINDAVEVDAYINKISKEADVSRDAVYSEYKKKIAKEVQRTKTYIHSQREQTVESPISASLFEDKSKTLLSAEKKLISLMSGSKKYISEVMKNFQPEDFSNEIHQKIVRLIYDAKNNGKTVEPSLILNEFASNKIGYVSDIFYNMEEYEDSDKALRELIKNIKIEKLAALLAQTKDPKIARELAFQMDKLRRNVENG